MDNAIVVMFDSLQFNYLGCYGNTWIKTPAMDRFAREGVLFENCYTEGLPTVPCRRAMHTGRFTLPFAGWTALTMEDTTIADLCWGRPIDTALIFDCPNYRLPKFGYTRGFDKVWFTHGHEADEAFYANMPLLHHKVEDYVESDVVKKLTGLMGEQVASVNLQEIADFLKVRENAGYDRHIAKTMPAALSYLEQVDRNKQFFLWIDSFDPHEPWDAPSVYNPSMKCPYDPDYKGKDEFLPYPMAVEDLYSEAQLNHVRMLYAECVTVCDTWFGIFLDAIRALGFEENTLIMMVSDHGEPMGNAEHGHGIMRKCRPWPYEELVHTPMLLRAPGVNAGQRIKAFVQSVDVAPTVCDWLGIGVHPDMHGKSLMPLVRGEVARVRDFAIAGYYPYSWALYTEEWSYIHWNNENVVNNPLEMSSFYTQGVDMSHLSKDDVHDMRQAYADAKEDVEEIGLGNNNTLDGAAQWTCTPSATSELPEKDELYNRIADPFQLHNVIEKHPDIAKKLFDTLKVTMAELRAS